MTKTKLKKIKKTCKKVLTLKTRCGIIYKSTRYGTEWEPRSLDTLKFVLSKLNIEPIKKRMCGSSAFKARDQVKLISFNNKSQIGSSKISFFGEFDPGSGRTLAACLTHASRTEKVQHKAFKHSRAAVKIFACEHFYYAFQSMQYMLRRRILSALCWTFLVANGWVTRRQPAL